jgi:hypothetical protein
MALISSFPHLSLIQILKGYHLTLTISTSPFTFFQYFDDSCRISYCHTPIWNISSDYTSCSYCATFTNGDAGPETKRREHESALWNAAHTLLSLLLSYTHMIDTFPPLEKKRKGKTSQRNKNLPPRPSIQYKFAHTQVFLPIETGRALSYPASLSVIETECVAA